MLHLMLDACADSENFVRRVSTMTTFFSLSLFFLFFVVVVGEVREDPNYTKSGPSSARHRNAILIAFRWRVDNGQA